MRVRLADEDHVRLEHVPDHVPERDELRAVAEPQRVSDLSSGGPLQRGAELAHARARHHCARDDYDVIVVPFAEGSTDPFDRVEKEGVRERAALVGRGGHEEDRHVAGRGRFELRGGTQALRVPADEVLQPRLLYRCAALLETPDRLRVDVDAEYVVALARQNGGERCAELPQPDDRDLHGRASAVIRRCQPNARSNLRNTGAGITRKWGSFT